MMILIILLIIDILNDVDNNIYDRSIIFKLLFQHIKIVTVLQTSGESDIQLFSI